MKMLLDEFSDIMSELEQVYGEMEGGKLEVYYKYLGNFSGDILREAVREIINSHEYKGFPVIGKIYKMAEFFISQKHSGTNLPVYCPKCESGGIVTGEKNGRKLAFRCYCKNGDAYKKTLPLYDEEKHALEKPLEKILDVIRFSEIERDRGLMFPEGVTVIFPCKSDGCYQEYRVDYKRRISAAEVIEAHNRASEGKAGGLCENCYYLAGKYYYLWT